MFPHFREKIEATKTFKELNKFQQEMTLKKNNMRHIEHGVNVSKNSGYDYFEKTNQQYSERNKNIVREIHEAQQLKSA